MSCLDESPVMMWMIHEGGFFFSLEDSTILSRSSISNISLLWTVPIVIRPGCVDGMRTLRLLLVACPLCSGSHKIPGAHVSELSDVFRSFSHGIRPVSNGKVKQNQSWSAKAYRRL